MTTANASTIPASGTTATQGAINANFLSTLRAGIQSGILGSIAGHYGINQEAAYAEVTDADAHHLLDYMVEPQRSATAVLMRQHGSF